MGIHEVLLPYRKEILEIPAKYGAYNVRVFGSVARGEAKPESDVDFLVEIEPQRSLSDTNAPLTAIILTALLKEVSLR
ncbi:nucleotidyltransferase family protein [Mastigocladopsis repens]|uniref:nucleotidyltransferase family protein n=1 Tax=Mastigocladopsis repens TaxID=221287 RepID=UPI0002F424FF|nr:nucleotidyltransferase domain-containing protein [Mastigocladopsis repens]